LPCHALSREAARAAWRQCYPQGHRDGKKSCQKNAANTTQPNRANGHTGNAKVKYIVHTKQAIRSQ